jgi:hypothetical protein
MPLYPESIPCCQHIKDDGVQCASPALRRQKFCYFHKQWRQKRLEINTHIQRERWKITLPILEDANSIQLGLVQVMRLLGTGQIDHRTATLMVHTLQIASTNLKQTSFEPDLPRRNDLRARAKLREKLRVNPMPGGELPEVSLLSKSKKVQGSFDSAGASLREVPAPLKMTR